MNGIIYPSILPILNCAIACLPKLTPKAKNSTPQKSPPNVGTSPVFAIAPV
ncbi:hypothetical protein PN488_13880 [Nodularia spumigena CS-591/12]|uniref:hypothetical protein n=1 Tax=Nodularia spumigena TaxID=70799 RepID=UPI00232CE670|nr:hypothetical protein [Nodularia spumigena]MDB9305451.1 hypothetical protein [Nodularia spumigena CS-591/12]